MTEGSGNTAGDPGATPAPPGASALYDWWLGALPGWFGFGAKRGNDATPPASEAAGPHGALPPPVNHIADSLALTGEMLNALYAGYLRTLTAGRMDDPVVTFEHWVQGQITRLREQLVGLGGALPGLSAGLGGNAAGGLGARGLAALSAPIAAATEALKPLGLGADRAFGGLADAMGLAPLRTLQQALAEMGRAALDHQQAQAAYLEIVSDALGRGGETAVARLSAMRERGESVDTLLELTRLWAQSTDAAMHAAMQSPQALQASAATLRAVARWRHQQQRVVALLSEALNVPTRAELDDAYREIHELKRELRRMRRALPRTAMEVDDGPSAVPRAPARATSQKTPRGNSKRASKTTRARDRAGRP